jgi:hypothetical protein
MTAEYFRPTTCATKNAMFSPASAMAFAIAKPQAGLVVSSTRSVGLRKPTARFRRGRGYFLARNRVELDRRAGFIARIAIPHEHAQIRSGVRDGLKRLRKGSDLVLDLFSPKGNVFYGDRHGGSSSFCFLENGCRDSTPAACFAKGAKYRYRAPRRLAFLWSGYRPVWFLFSFLASLCPHFAHG